MRGYKEPGFQDRTAAAQDARKKALEQLRTDCSPSQLQLLQQWQAYAQALQARFAVNSAGV